VTRIAWFHCSSGIAGDMALGALLDAGADLTEVTSLLRRLPISGWRLDVEVTQRAGVGATRAIVTAPEAGQPERRLADIEQLVTGASLPERATRRALATFRRLAAAEGAVHRIDPGLVHFHEVGALDAIVDVVGACAALEVLGIDDVQASAVALGVGTITTDHGVLPNPPPAVVVLLEGAPTYGVDVDLELTTPTGAALLAALVSAWGPSPPMTLRAVGYGAGGRDLPARANVAQVVVGDAAATMPLTQGQPVMLLEANVDDTTGEVLAHAISALLARGAHDAWVTPIVMKKGRPAHTVHALCDPALADAVGATLVAETGSLGLRGQRLERWPQARTESVVSVGGEPVRVKVSAARVKAEHDDAAAAAARLALPLREVLHRAEALTATTDEAPAGRGEPETGPPSP
jgi:hypothetical protein